MMSQFDSPMIGNPARFAFPCSFGVVDSELSSALKGQSPTPAAIGLEAPHFAARDSRVASFFGNSSPWAEGAIRECFAQPLTPLPVMVAAFFSTIFV